MLANFDIDCTKNLIIQIHSTRNDTLLNEILYIKVSLSLASPTTVGRMIIFARWLSVSCLQLNSMVEQKEARSGHLTQLFPTCLNSSCDKRHLNHRPLYQKHARYSF